jgi:hypothetical protein
VFEEQRFLIEVKDASLFGRERGEFEAIQLYPALAGWNQTGDGFEQSCFATAGFSDENQRTTGRYVTAGGINDGGSASKHRHMLNPQAVTCGREQICCCGGGAGAASGGSGER